MLEDKTRVISNPHAVIKSTYDKKRLDLAPSDIEISELQTKIQKHEVQMIGDLKKYLVKTDKYAEEIEP